jgi:hypothetical protein
MSHVTLNKVKYPVRFNFNVLKEFEKLTGHNAFELGKTKFGATETIAFCYVGLKGANKDLKMTIEEVGEVIKMNVINDLMTAYITDMEELMGEDEGK